MGAYSELLCGHREFFATGVTRDIEWRKSQIRGLKSTIKKHESAIMDALRQDLGKSAFESYTSEVGFLYEEINVALRELDDWANPRHVSTPVFIAPARSYVLLEPVGTVLVVAPWNYPFHLVFAPLVAAIAAGNCVVVKPSELSPHTSSVVEQVIKEAFLPGHVSVITGAAVVSTALLEERFDHIFFTGSTAVGRLVMQAAAKNLTPVTLELGGKSPCIVDASTNLKVAARRIVWGKFYNAGQTCVAPDYLLIEAGIRDQFLEYAKGAIRDFFGHDPSKSEDYGRIINVRHFERLEQYLSGATLITGGQVEKSTRYIAPTLIEAPSEDLPVMQEEIFGPILPVKCWNQPQEAFDVIASRPKPLALYCFSSNDETRDLFMKGLSFGGGCINNTLVHLANPDLPFGGIGDSGIGRYHGRYGFETFSHRKSVVEAAIFPDIPLKYPPYKGRLKWIRALVR